ncbi:hypothetical protein HAX54_012627 [Datura stramonium]|uniref:Uncharacterized protein n=1 Tax=Datura stramonium TaxID=4076 RepID=A0ABS8RXK7_DATST|nr:hypothetical protein [Datura stramonium]
MGLGNPVDEVIVSFYDAFQILSGVLSRALPSFAGNLRRWIAKILDFTTAESPWKGVFLSVLLEGPMLLPISSTLHNLTSLDLPIYALIPPISMGNSSGSDRDPLRRKQKRSDVLGHKAAHASLIMKEASLSSSQDWVRQLSPRTDMCESTRGEDPQFLHNIRAGEWSSSSNRLSQLPKAYDLRGRSSKKVEVPAECFVNNSVYATTQASMLAVKNLQRWLKDKKELELRPRVSLPLPIQGRATLCIEGSLSYKKWVPTTSTSSPFDRLPISGEEHISLLSLLPPTMKWGKLGSGLLIEGPISGDSSQKVPVGSHA